MKKIAIKPHKTRGIELIKILERMGGHNSHHLDGFSFRDDTAYLINENGIITSYTEHLCHEKGYKIYTLEEWEDEYKSDEMIEGLVEEERVSNVNSITQDRVDKLACKIDEELPSGNPYEWECPEGYQFVDENGNVINAKTIVLEKKKKEYPKTYEECCKVLNYCYDPVATKTLHKEELIRKFQFLLMYRDAYWKLYCEEMELGEPWEPDWQDDTTHKFIIHTIKDKIHCGVSLVKNHLLAFPTEEMRDAFYENFKEEIEICKELL